MLQMETHRYDIELKSEDNETPVARHPVTVQVSVRCFMHELHKVTPLEPLSETDWQCVRQLVALLQGSWRKTTSESIRGLDQGLESRPGTRPHEERMARTMPHTSTTWRRRG